MHLITGLQQEILVLAFSKILVLPQHISAGQDPGPNHEPNHSARGERAYSNTVGVSQKKNL